jgi:hypothetical protein
MYVTVLNSVLEIGLKTQPVLISKYVIYALCYTSYIVKSIKISQSCSKVATPGWWWDGRPCPTLLVAYILEIVENPTVSQLFVYNSVMLKHI